MTPITELTVESGTYALFNEFLQGLFDGNAHNVGGNTGVQFTKAALSFGQSAPPQPLNARQIDPPAAEQVSITMVMSQPGHSIRRWDAVDGTQQLMIHAQTRLNFFIRAEGGNNPRKICQTTAGLLAGVLGNPAATRALAQNGVRHLRPGVPQVVAETAYVLRLVVCAVTLRYPIKIN